MTRGSIPWFSHQVSSLPRRCSSRWCSLQMGTVKRSLTFRPIARCSANLRWCASDGVRPQTRQGCEATNFRCSRSRSRTGFLNDGDGLFGEGPTVVGSQPGCGSSAVPAQIPRAGSTSQ